MGEEAQRFTDLRAWHKARELTATIYVVTRTSAFATDYGLSTQIQRAAVSVMSNVAEGFERGRRAAFAQYFPIAKSSCGEVWSQLYVALDAGYLDQTTFDSLQSCAEEVTRILGGLRSAVERQHRPRLKRD